MRRAVVGWLLVLAATGVGAQSIDYHFNGMWYQSALAGHGLNLVLQTSDAGKFVFVTFFTYDDTGLANFYSGSTEVPDWRLGETLELPMFQSHGGGFADPRAIDFDSQDEFFAAGTLSLRLDDCRRGAVSLSLAERSNGDVVANNYPIEKLIGVPIDTCQATQTGALTRTTTIESLSLDGYRYFLYVPNTYDPNQPLPLVIAWHGAAGPGRAEEQAEIVRDRWAPTAESEAFIVLAQTGTSPNGSWIPPTTASVLGQLLDEVQRDYAIDSRRIYGWGFSAGGHVMHSIALANPTLFAGYAVNAGALNAVVGQQNLDRVARQLPVSILVGASDALLSEVRGDRAAFLESGWVEDETLFYREFSGGHSFNADLLSEHWTNLRAQQLPVNLPSGIRNAVQPPLGAR